MNGLELISENQLLDSWGRMFPRPPNQLGSIHETDAELLDLGNGVLLAQTVDQVVEEVEAGLYRDPETIGRMAVTASLSDLAAVGARPLGLLLSVTLPRKDKGLVQAAVGRGVADVLQRSGCHVLGGDTSEGATLSVTCVASGLVKAPGLWDLQAKDPSVRQSLHPGPHRCSGSKYLGMPSPIRLGGPGASTASLAGSSTRSPLSRMGCTPGDVLYTSGAAGLGAAFAARLLHRDRCRADGESWFRPEIRLDVGQSLVGKASACIDSSDGLISAVDQLARLNRVRVRLDRPLQSVLRVEARDVQEAVGVSSLVMLASIHGDFELIFSIPARRCLSWEHHASRLGLQWLRIGVIEGGAGVVVGDRALDTTSIRNLWSTCDGDPLRYMRELRAICDV